MNRNIKLTLTYEGSSFFGWEESRNHPTIEGELKKALQKILSEPLFLQAASRTDRGVHATYQVVNFITKNKIDTKKLLYSLNCLLPSSIRLLDIAEMDLSFHPTLDAVSKSYRYNLTLSPIQLPFDRHFSWHIPKPLSLEKMEKSLPLFLGKKDFSSFCNARKELSRDHMCDIQEMRMEKKEDHLSIFITGDRFLYKMVRNIVGTLVYIGLNKIGVEELPSIIAAHRRSKAGITAPAHGLTLTHIFYPNQIKNPL